jgi:hypothetical protein
MKNTTAPRALSLAMAAAILCFAARPVMADDQEDSTIRPGIGLGIVKLGMDKDQLKKTAGNIDGSYSLPSGVRVDYSEWKETPPKQSSNMRFFYNAQGKIIQINSTAPVPATADGINCKSTLAQIEAKYKNLKCSEYRGKGARIDYYDDIEGGIAFEFTRADAEADKLLYAIIMHLPGKTVIADTGEKLLHVKVR